MPAIAKVRKSRFVRPETDLPVHVQAQIGSVVNELRRGMDFVERDGHYLFTQNCYETICSAPLPEPEPPFTPPPDVQKPILSRWGVPPSCDDPRQRALVVVQIPLNPIMLIARSPNFGTLNHHCMVGRNENFTVGMPFNAIPHPKEPAFWRLVGVPPVMKGRWG